VITRVDGGKIVRGAVRYYSGRFRGPDDVVTKLRNELTALDWRMLGARLWTSYWDEYVTPDERLAYLGVLRTDDWGGLQNWYIDPAVREAFALGLFAEFFDCVD